MTIIGTRNQLPKLENVITTTSSDKSNIQSPSLLLHHSNTNRATQQQQQEQQEQQQQQRRRRRVVVFKDTVSVRPILHVKDMSEDSIHAVWYTKKDFEAMKKSFASTVKLMTTHGDNFSHVDKDEHCSRGLEYRTREGATLRRENKWNALNAVLDEQDRQQENGLFNETLLCQVYVKENCHCRLQALKLGIQDEQAAKAIHLEMKESNHNDDMMDVSSNSDLSDDAMDYCHAYQPPAPSPIQKSTT
jgi:hypothetical protein